jgi:hypothetical protein
VSRADELRRQADLIERMDDLAADVERALEAHRADVSDPDAKAAYRDAVAALQEARAADRADRSGLGLVAESVVAEG